MGAIARRATAAETNDHHLMPDFTVNLLPLLPPWIIAIIAVALLVLLVHGARMLLQRHVPQRWIFLLFNLRVLIIAVFVACLLRPTVARWQEQERQPTLLVLADVSRSMGQAGAAGDSTRFDETTGAMFSKERLAKIRQTYDLHCYAFGDSAQPVGANTLTSTKPTGESTRIGHSLESAWNQYRAASGAASEPDSVRVLLISDGANRAGDDSVATAQRLGLRIDTLTPATGQDNAGQPPLHIADVQCSKRVLLNSETRFRVALTGSATIDEQTLVVAYNDKPFYEQPLTATSELTEQHVIVTHQAKDPGIARYTFSLSPQVADVVPYEATVEVVDARHEVLLLEDTWRWEFKYVRRVLEDDPSFNLTAFLSRGKSSYVQFREPECNVSLAGYPEGPADIYQFDLIVLGNVNPERWPPGLAKSIADSVIDRGKSLVIIAGPDIVRLARVRELNPLFPVEIGMRAGIPVKGPISLRITSEAAALPYFSVNADTHDVLPSQALPPVDRLFAPVRKRPAATVLLESTQHANAHGKLIVMAEHTVGRGRVLYIGTDTLWKWQAFGATDKTRATLHGRFWQQTLRAMAPQLPVSEAGDLRVQTDHTRYTAGEQVELVAGLYPPEGATATINATIVMPDGQRFSAPLSHDPRKTGRQLTQFRVQLPGRYRILTSATRDSEVIAESETSIEVCPAPTELSDTTVNATLMARLAEATGGAVIDLADTATWPTEPEAAKRTVRRRVIHDLWYNFTLPLLLIGLLGIDWLLRLARGYF